MIRTDPLFKERRELTEEFVADAMLLRNILAKIWTDLKFETPSAKLRPSRPSGPPM